MSQPKQAQAGWLGRSIEAAKKEVDSDWASRVRQNLKTTLPSSAPKAKSAPQ